VPGRRRAGFASPRNEGGKEWAAKGEESNSLPRAKPVPERCGRHGVAQGHPNRNRKARLLTRVKSPRGWGKVLHRRRGRKHTAHIDLQKTKIHEERPKAAKVVQTRTGGNGYAGPAAGKGVFFTPTKNWGRLVGTPGNSRRLTRRSLERVGPTAFRKMGRMHPTRDTPAWKRGRQGHPNCGAGKGTRASQRHRAHVSFTNLRVPGKRELSGSGRAIRS